MSRPTVSVVLAVYNAAWCIERALDTVMAQSAPPLEVIVCDDGSSDGTADLVERRYGVRVRVMRLPHQNASAARIPGLAAASGDWLAFLDADDWWAPQKLERQLEFLEKHPEVRWLTSDGEYISDDGVIRESWLSDYFEPVRDRVGDLFEPLARRCYPLMSSMLVDRNAYQQIGGMDPRIVYSHDFDLWLRLAARFPGAVMADRLISYWSHPNALSRNYEARHRDDLMLMERIAAGELRPEPAMRELGEARASTLAFQIGLNCLRTGRGAEGRAMLRRAARSGPPRRRMMATFAASLPDFLLPQLMRMQWLKGAITSTRAANHVERDATHPAVATGPDRADSA